MTIHTTITSPLGDLLLVGKESAAARGGFTLTSLSFLGQRNARRPDRDSRRAPAAFAEVQRQLEGYFAGDLQRFDLDSTTGGTPFQEQVWAALDVVPYGTSTTYGHLAELLGAPRSALRAIGSAIGANPLLIVRPCHRVVGADGSMTGYAGGTERKQFLLSHEGALQPLLV